MTEPLRPSVKAQKSLWNALAFQNAAYAILGDEAMLDDARRDAAFEAAAAVDARRLVWFLNPQARVVDLGCGLGRVMKPLAPYCAEITGVDISPEMVRGARAYLSGIANARVVETAGTELPDLDDGSVDFLFSLLCLIHVDKRSAYAYFREFARVLVPEGRVQLQFQNILTPEGLAKFEGVVGTDYPLEFYTEDEIRMKLARVGLSVLTVETSAEYLFVQAVKGDAEAYVERFRAAIVIDSSRGTGFFATPQASLSMPGTMAIRVQNRGTVTRTLAAVLSVTPETSGPDHFQFLGEGVFTLAPGRAADLVAHYAGDGATVTFRLDGAPLIHPGGGRGAGPARGHARVNMGLLPGGFPWNDATVARFPAWFHVSPIELV